MVFTGCRGISAPVPGALPPPLSSLTLVSAGMVLSHFSLLSLPAAVQPFLPFLKYVITEALPASVMGSALGSSGSVFERAVSDVGDGPTHPGLFSQKSSLQANRYENLAT